MEHKIIELLSSKQNNNLTLEEISLRLRVGKEELEEVIKFLEEDGTIFLNKGGKYSLTSRSSLKRGVIKVTKRKGPIVVLDDDTEFDLLPNSHKKVLHNDIVLVEPNIKSGTAQLFKVIERKYADYVGTVVKEGNIYKLIFKDREPVKLSKKYPLGTKLLLDGKTGVIKMIVGHKDDPDILIKEVLLENGFPVEFSDEYLRELESIPDELDDEIISDEKRNGRLDIRKVNLVTIDGDDTKDFDDAVCFDGNTLYISIADVQYTIKEDSAIDKDTISRGISVYPPGKVNPMIHHKISNGMCSLVPGEDRFTVSSVTKFDEHVGERVSCRIVPTIINSKMRMTYQDVNLFLEDKIVLPEYEEYIEMLKSLYDFAMVQKKKMLNEGFLEFSSSEIKIIFEEEKVTNVKKRHHGKAEQLIEFLMLYHNLEMTSEFIRRGLPFIARNHDEPRHEKITAWNNLLRQRGYKVDIKKKYTSEDIRKSLGSYKGKLEQIVLDNIAIRGQSKAKYSAYNRGHFALGVKAYATFTSPIRRLSDYINQRIYADALKYGNKYAREKWEPRMEALARIATSSELRADKVEKYAEKIRTAEYMASLPMGSEYTALIASIGEEHIKILLPNMVYGKVYYSSKDYTVSKDGFSLINNKTGETFLVGDTIDVILKEVNVELGEIVFSRKKYVKEYKNEEEKKGKTKVKNR